MAMPASRRPQFQSLPLPPPMMIRLHDFEINVVQISVRKNPQKQRKPNADPTKRAESYWDLRGQWQHEYDERLDALPDDGASETVAGEIFRAATKLYYDFHNNAMVNNTSGAINYLAKTGVLSDKRDSKDDGKSNIFHIIHPYTIGSKIHFGELDILHAMEEMLTRTIEFLREHPELETAHNTMNYHDLRERDEKACMERCSIRNRVALEMSADASRWSKEMNCREKAQDTSGGISVSLKSSANKKKKKIKRKKKKVLGESNTKDIAFKFSKLGLLE